MVDDTLYGKLVVPGFDHAADAVFVFRPVDTLALLDVLELVAEY